MVASTGNAWTLRETRRSPGIGCPRPRDALSARHRDTSDASAFAIIGRLVLALCHSSPLPLNFPLVSPQSCCRRHADRPPSPADATNARPLDITHDARHLASRVPVRKHTLSPGTYITAYRITLPTFVRSLVFL